MTKKDVLLIGSGRRLREAALPAFRRMPEQFRLRRIVAKTPKRIEVEGETYEVGAFADLRADDFRGVDLVYLAVAKDAVPSVLQALQAFDPGSFELLIDTPVVRFRNFRHARLLARFRSVSVAEDCAFLPWIDTVQAFLASGALGQLQGLHFQQSAYAYHATATAKALFRSERIRRARREKLGGAFAERNFELAGGGRMRLLEPRDYGVGRLLLLGTKGSITDYPLEAKGNHLLEPVESGGSLRGFAIGSTTTALDQAEAELTQGSYHGPRITGRMEGLKRVGFLRLLRRIAAGQPAYPLAQALEDMVVDYHLERFGRYWSTPLTRPDALLGRTILGVVTK